MFLLHEQPLVMKAEERCFQDDNPILFLFSCRVQDIFTSSGGVLNFSKGEKRIPSFVVKKKCSYKNDKLISPHKKREEKSRIEI